MTNINETIENIKEIASYIVKVAENNNLFYSAEGDHVYLMSADEEVEIFMGETFSNEDNNIALQNIEEAIEENDFDIRVLNDENEFGLVHIANINRTTDSVTEIRTIFNLVTRKVEMSSHKIDTRTRWQKQLQAEIDAIKA